MLVFNVFLCLVLLFDEFCYINTDCLLLKLLIIVKFTIKIYMALEKYIKITDFLLKMKYFLFTENNLCHHMPIKHNISMFEQKIAKIFEEILPLKGNIPNLLH